MNTVVTPQDKFELRQVAIEQKIDDHILESQQYREQNQEMFVKLLQSTKANTDSIGDLTKATAGIVEVYVASQGAIKVGTAVGRFVKWCTGLAIVGVGFKWVWDHLGGPPFTS
tara:strand:+ start:34904 stop:35242 length:339 start_codon:yes stop_codon:yes gene_type:complete